MKEFPCAAGSASERRVSSCALEEERHERAIQEQGRENEKTKKMALLSALFLSTRSLLARQAEPLPRFEEEIECPDQKLVSQTPLERAIAHLSRSLSHALFYLTSSPCLRGFFQTRINAPARPVESRKFDSRCPPSALLLPAARARSLLSPPPPRLALGPARPLPHPHRRRRGLQGRAPRRQHL